MTCIRLAINLKQYYTLTTIRWLALWVPLNKNAGSPDCKLLSDNINYELTRINEWLALNKLNLNINKTKSIIQFLHADSISLTPPRARHLTLRKLLWRKVVTLWSACSGRNFRCINVFFLACFCERQRARGLKAELTFNNDLRTPKKNYAFLMDRRWRPFVVYCSKCQNWSVNRSVKGTSKASYPVRAS